MKRTGHYGMSMIVYSPVAFTLYSLGYELLSVLGLFIVLLGSSIPDLDHKLPIIRHRGITHTGFFAVLYGVSLGALVYVSHEAVFELLVASFPPEYSIPAWIQSKVQSGVVFAVFGTYSILGHFGGDIVTPYGIPLLWPLRSKKYTLDLARYDDPLLNYLASLFGIIGIVVAFVAAARF